MNDHQITSFSGEHDFLSNFEHSQIDFEYRDELGDVHELTAGTVEHAFKRIKHVVYLRLWTFCLCLLLARQSALVESLIFARDGKIVNGM